MAEEFDITLKGKLTNGNHTENWGSTASRKFNQSSVGAHGSVVTVGYAASEILSVGDVTTQGFMYMKNLDSTNFVTYGPMISGVMVEFGKIKPTEEVWLRVMPTGSFAAQADPTGSGDVQLKILLFED